MEEEEGEESILGGVEEAWTHREGFRVVRNMFDGSGKA